MILGIDTSSKNCSIALWEGLAFLDGFDQVSEDFLHAEILHSEIQNLMQKHSVKFTDLTGIVVGSGPGSYTGLRIGVAAAKGLAMALNLPLYAVSGLQLMLSQSAIDFDGKILVVMDARRDEVFGSWRRDDKTLDEPKAMVINEAFLDSLSNQPIMVIGENASKLRTLLPTSAQFFDILPSISAVSKFGIDLGPAVSCAYFEPVYVKPFIPTVSKR